MFYIPLPDDAARQTIDAMALWREWARVKRQYSNYAAGMYWKKERGYEYLVKTKTRGGSTAPLGLAVFRRLLSTS